ncbi:uncharacterized protein LOC122506604 isoform X1 [Leptopilina heterotoma]|uniref:uncharacterized protein LOC122506604 isoform X1 n=1 Tax=Leptopilina heterotoma TaxID=63436 RepID=UPI001CA814E6|nr:uncharacterized protein LOC122506604 isoform X1 [Leptopilina heterotoma]
MSNNENRFFLLDSFIENGWFYVVSKSAILVTDEMEIKIGEKVQFAYPEDVVQPKIESDEYLIEEMNKKIEEIEKKDVTREELKEQEKLEYEEKRLRLVEKARKGNIAMAIELEKELSPKEENKNLLNIIDEALTLTEKGKAELTKINKNLSKWME